MRKREADLNLTQVCILMQVASSSFFVFSTYKKNQIISFEGSHTLTSDGDTTTLGSRHGRRAAMSNSLPITASNASI